jgi:hypothetical protein
VVSTIPLNSRGISLRLPRLANMKTIMRVEPIKSGVRRPQRSIKSKARMVITTLMGMNVMMLYITYVFGMAGLTGNSNLVASSIQYVINKFE